MPRNGSGTYSLPTNALAVANTTASSTYYNNFLNDCASALTGSISSDGQTTITGGLKGYAGTAVAPGYSFASDAQTGLYLPATGSLGIVVGGNNSATFSTTGFSDGAIATIASATTTDLSTSNSNNISISGTTTITGLGTVPAGTVKRLTFQSALVLTHNAASLILPGAANITTAGGDVAFLQSLGSGNWRCLFYQRSASPATRTIAQIVNAMGTGTGTTTNLMPNGGSNTGGAQFATATITPQNANSTLIVFVSFTASNTATNNLNSNLLNGTTIVQGGTTYLAAANSIATQSYLYVLPSPGTAAITFNLRVGGSLAGTTTFNSGNSTLSGFVIFEVLP